METKLDKVLDILNMFEFFYGQRAGRELWAGKSVEVQNQDITNFVNNIKYIKDFLNESVILSKTDYELLTDIKALQLQVQDSLNNMSNEDIARIEKQASKETAKKFYDRFNEKICYFKLEHNSEEYTDGYAQAIADVCGRLDEVAKELGVNIKE